MVKEAGERISHFKKIFYLEKININPYCSQQGTRRLQTEVLRCSAGNGKDYVLFVNDILQKKSIVNPTSLPFRSAISSAAPVVDSGLSTSSASPAFPSTM